MIYPSQLPGVKNLPKAPAIAVSSKVFDKNATFDDIEKELNV
ncbi:hypothetical protein [Desulfoscipio gibsoniae]|nr:hypothetical protein [Desulfoscipio gibsoniae]